MHLPLKWGSTKAIAALSNVGAIQGNGVPTKLGNGCSAASQTDNRQLGCGNQP